MKLQKRYYTEILPQVQKELKLANVFSVPRLKKIVVNVGLGEALSNKKVIDTVVEQITAICGQRPVKTHAKKAIATFKLQQGDIVGVKVTLRGNRMFDFFEKIVTIVLPRIRDFRGVPDTCFDKKGSYTLGFPEQIVFPEIEYSKVDKLRGLEVTIVTSGTNPKDTRLLLEKMGMPFIKRK